MMMIAQPAGRMIKTWPDRLLLHSLGEAPHYSKTLLPPCRKRMINSSINCLVRTWVMVSSY
jgi:hypothetical protein